MMQITTKQLVVMLTSRVTFDLQGPPKSTGWTRKL